MSKPNTDPIWMREEQQAARLRVIEILTSLFARCDLARELEDAEITALLDHLNDLVSSAHREALAIMDLDRDRCQAR